MENKLSEIVPPYQLCNLIPARCFTDSYAVYPCYLVTYDFGDSIPRGPYHRVGVPVTREYWNDVINKGIEPCVTKYAVPAPTLEELLKEFAIYKAKGDIEGFKCQKGESEFANDVADLLENENEIKLLLSCQATTLRPVPTSAPEALELWLKLKGIKDEYL